MQSQPQAYEDLVEKLFDDRLTEGELQQLNDVLRQSPEARDHFWHLVMLEGHLADLPGWIAGQQYATQLAFSETLEAFIEMEENAEAQLQTYPPASSTTEKDRAEDQPITWQDVRMAGAFCIRSLARQKAVRGVAAAAMICIVALVYATWFGGDPSQPIAGQVPDWEQETPQAAPLPVAPTTVAVVTNHSVPAGRRTENIWLPGTKLAQGQVITLRAGSAVQLEYASGASAILSGPGEFKLLSPERVGMEHGQISALVPPQAMGFTVSTTQTDFIDLGTEFVVALDKDGHGEVVVLDGLIEAKPVATEAQQSLNQPQSVMLHEGFGGRLVPNEALPNAVQPITASQADRYTRNWDDVVYRPDVSGQITYTASPPASLELGQASTSDPLLIPERRGVTLAEDLHLNSDKANRLIIKKLGLQVDPQQDYVIPAGTELNSFLIHFDITGEDAQEVIERDFKLRFNGRIVGIVEVQKHQLATDELFGLASMQYPTASALRGASDPPGHPNYDAIYVSGDRRTMSVKMRLRGMDHIRVLVENTDP